MKKTKKPLSGGARLIASGRHPVLLGLQPDQLAKIRSAASADNRPVTQFLIHYGIAAAEKIIAKMANRD